ncbi:MAG: LysM peptidoglycan-binding domain-containing protein [Bacteroidales bacterium]|nr:LysM peptidoglycan-binding domain-containing protein [Bacteroidales bacterium]
MKKTFALFALLSICLITWAQTPVIVTKQIKTINGKNYYAHVVEKGQTVFSIARAYGVNYREAVLKSDIDKIAIGDTVFLPTNEKPAPAQFHYYVVKQGNTLYSIAKTYQVEVDDILKLNPKIENNNIKVGEVIKIPMERTKKEESQKPQPTTPRSQNILDNSQPQQQNQSAKQTNNDTQLSAKEKKELEKQQKEAEAKAKKEQERLDKEAKQKEAKEKKELEKQLKEAQEAEAKAKKEREKIQKELEEKEAKEKKDLEKQQKEAEAKERKEQERILKEIREKEAKEKKELERQQKEAAEKEAKERKALEKQQKEAEAKAKKEQEQLAKQQKEAAEKEAKAKKELEKQQKEAAEKEAKEKRALEKQQKEAETKAKKEQERQQKEADEKELNEKKELERQLKEAKEAEAKAIKEKEKLQKELEERDAKEKKEQEKQQKEADKKSKSNPKAEYHKIDDSGSGPKHYDEANQTGRNTMLQPEQKSEPAQIAQNDPKPTQTTVAEKKQPRQLTTYQPQPATESSSETFHELPLQTAPNIGNSVASPNLVIRNRVSNTEIHITLMMPLYLSNIDEISTSKFDIEQRKKRKYKSFEFIQFYEGVLLGIESLKNEGCNVILNVVDIPGDLPDKVEQSFSTYNIAQSDLIIALLEKNAFEKAAQLAQQNNVFILNPFSSRPEILDQNPYVVKLAPSYQGIISSVLSMVTKSYSSPNLFIVHSNGKLEKRFLDEFQQQLKNQNKIKYTIFDWSANAKLVGMLKNSPDDNIVINLYDQNKDKNKTQSSLILNRLFSVKKNTPTLITMPNWASKYEDIDYNQLQRLNYHFLSNSYLDYNNPKHKAFIERFKEKYKTEPMGNYAALGNDIIIHFVSGINSKGTEKFWQDPNTERRHSMLYYFYFKRSAPDKGFENQNAYFYRLNTKYQFVPAN